MAALLALVAVAIPWVIATTHGAVGIPRHDDWAYYRVAFRFADTHTFLPESSSAMLIGQVLLAYPIIKALGHSVLALQALVALFGVLGLWSTFLLVRGFLSRSHSLVATAILAMGPMFGILTASFMTDVPAFALQMVTLLLGVRALRHRGSSMLWWLALALVVGLMALSIREFALAAGGAVALTALYRGWGADRRTFKPMVLLISIWSAAAVALVHWRRSLPNHSFKEATGQVLDLSPASMVALTWAGLLSLSIFIFPAWSALAPSRLANRLRTHPPIVQVLPPFFLVALAGSALLAGAGAGFLGDYFTWSLPYSMATGGEPPAILPIYWLLGLFVIALVGVAMLTILSSLIMLEFPSMIRSDSPRDHEVQSVSIVGTYLGVWLAGHAALLLVTHTFVSDRYLLPVVPLLAALILHLGSTFDCLTTSSRKAALAGLTLLSMVGLYNVEVAASFDAEKWRFNSSLVDLGYRPEMIDGGYEWFGTNQSDLWNPRVAEHRETGWVAQWSKRPICVWVSFDDGTPLQPGEALVARREVSSFLGRIAELKAVTKSELPEACS